MTIKIKDWDNFQHFKDRTPPWIKLYRGVLDDPDWHALDGKTAKVLVMLWLLASEDKKMEGCLPDIRTISFRLRIPESDIKEAIVKLNHWLISDDISVISERHQHDAPETETETYRKETEAEANALAHDFEVFWVGWIPFNMPKGSKQDAAKSYFRARKAIDHATLIGTRDQYLANCKNLRSKTKHASSWLNGRGWENDDAIGAITTAGGGGHGSSKPAGGKTAGQLALEDRTYG